MNGQNPDPLLEMYSPIRERRTGRIIAVGEFYETADALKETLFQTNLQSWLVVSMATLIMMASLSAIVVRGSRTIERQRTQLQGRIEELSRLLRQNETLRRRLQASYNRIAEINERYLRRIGADLHDGPAQLLGFALLRLDSLRSALRKPHSNLTDTDEIDVIRDALRDVMGEIREICAGLTLANLEEKPTMTILKEIIGTHEKRTGTTVKLTVESVPGSLSLPLKILVFRFVQEGLNNAYRHAGGVDQEVICRYDGGRLELVVADRGPGFAPQDEGEYEGGLGLNGLRERIEGLGGQPADFVRTQRRNSARLAVQRR